MSVVGQLGRAESQLGKFELGLVLSGVAIARARQLIRRPALRNPNLPLVQRRRIVHQPTRFIFPSVHLAHRYKRLVPATRPQRSIVSRRPRFIFSAAHPAHRYKSVTKPTIARKRAASRRPLFIFPTVRRQQRKAAIRPVAKPSIRPARRVAGIFVAPPTLIRVSRGVIKYRPLPVSRARKPRSTGHRLFHPTGMPFVRIARPAQRFKIRPLPSGVKSRPARRVLAPILVKARSAKRYRFVTAIRPAKPRVRRVIAPLLAIAHVVRRSKIIIRPKIVRRIQRKPESLIVPGPAVAMARRAGLRNRAPQVITITYYIGNNPVTVKIVDAIVVWRHRAGMQ